jgi:FHS family L-fucose permease-like MFS transporter
VLAVAIAMFRLPKIEDVTPSSEAGGAGDRKSAWSYRHLVLGAVAIFLYVGGEVAIGSFLVNYFKEPAIGGLTESAGARLVSFYWGGAMVGRFIGTLTLRIWKPAKVLTLHALAVVALILVTMTTHGTVAMWSVIAVGLFNSIMFPTIFTLTLERSNVSQSATSGLLSAAIVGGALLPLAVGAIADRFGLSAAFAVPLLGYAFIALFAVAAREGRAGSVVLLPAQGSPIP